jgi:hypothetical protein
MRSPLRAHLRRLRLHRRRHACRGAWSCFKDCTPSIHCFSSGQAGSSAGGTCLACFHGQCKAELAACAADPACDDYVQCAEGCGYGYDIPGCIDACQKQIGDGNAKQKALLACACSCGDCGLLGACAAFADAGAGGAK